MEPTGDANQNRPEGTSSGPPQPGARPRRSGQVVARQIGEETILIPVRSTKSELDDIFTLNEVAARTWNLIDGSNTIAGIAAIIASEYEVQPETALRDTIELIDLLDQADVLAITDD